MSSDFEQPHDANPWFTAAIRNAKDSALPNLLRSLLLEEGDGLEEAVANAVAVIELLLLAVAGKITETKARDALRMFAEPLSVTIGVPWENVADAILGTLEWPATDSRQWVMYS